MTVLVWVIIWIFFMNSSLSLRMTNMTLPRVVEQGRPIDISCEFEYLEEEREELGSQTGKLTCGLLCEHETTRGHVIINR